ncbi:hypothetical protein ABN117_17885 [Providencia manganoxydans]|uniref:hypothetical protein n=1 Tax=Providencia manganoxydans TaxID=2923283 RepID=UPI0032DB29A0
MEISNASPILFAQIFRSSGLWGGFDSASSFMSIGIIYLLCVYEYSAVKKYTLIIVLAVALFLTGARIGAGLILIAIVMLLLQKIATLQINKILKYSFLLCFILAILISLYLLLSKYQILPTQFNETLLRMSEVINNGGSTSSTDHLITMFYLPDDDFTLIFGNSLNSFSSEFSVQSDIEYIKFIWGIGLPLSLTLFIYLFIGMIYLSCKYSNNKKLHQFFIILFIIIGIASFKGEYFFAYRISTFYILIFWLSIYNHNDNISHHS